MLATEVPQTKQAVPFFPKLIRPAILSCRFCGPEFQTLSWMELQVHVDLKHGDAAEEIDHFIDATTPEA